MRRSRAAPFSDVDVTTITPRWEWRTFGSTFAPADEIVARLATGAAEESDERYFLGEADANVKVRDDLMDVKLLREVDADGLERWEPVMKQGFPLPPDDVRTVCSALRVSVPPSTEPYPLDRLIEEVLRPGGIEIVTVQKRRTRFSVSECMAEIAEVTADGHRTKTLAVESVDPTAVIGAVRSLHLDGYLNTSYPKGLAALVEGIGPRYAVIDVGTNSIKFHVGERVDGQWRAIVDRAEVTRLGEQLSASGDLSGEAVERTIEAIGGMVEEAKDLRAVAIVAVGTAGLRMAHNSADVVEEISTKAGVSVEVISGEEESRLAYRAVTAAIGAVEGSVVVFDTGGGSSQFTLGEGSRVVERFSLDVGALRYTEAFGLDGPVERDVLNDALAAISAGLSQLDGRVPPDALVGMGGAVTNLTAVMLGMAEYEPDRVQGATLDRAEVDRQMELYRTRDAAARREIVGLQPKRAEVILAGACVVRTVMDKLGKDAFTVSDRGLRHGVLLERFSGLRA
jgi:exopolyphosphatase/guanosine-5'-triphosphate,3'-diphosphate pyrophosphatase